MKLRLFSVIAILTTSSVGALAYLVHRTINEQDVNPSEKGTVPFTEGLIG